MCIFCYANHASAVPHLFLISITQILLKMSYLQKENKVTIHKTFMKRSKLETYGDFNGVMCHMRYGSSSSSLMVNSVQQQGSSGGTLQSDQVRVLHHVLR